MSLRKAIAALWLATTAAVAPGAPATQPTEAQRFRAADLARRAANEMDRANFVVARRDLRAALAIVGDRPTLLYNLALIDSVNDEPGEAMDDLQRAFDAGFTGFSRLQVDPGLRSLRDLPRFRQLLSRKDQIIRQAAARIVDELKQEFGSGYAYAVDGPNRLVFACDAGPQKLESVRKMLEIESASQRELLFSHELDQFVRVVVASPGDFARLEKRRGVAGRYDDESRRLLVKNAGPELRHEFTHAMHAADQHAFNQEHPVWLSEGLATLFEQPEYRIGANGRQRMAPADSWRLGRVKASARQHALIPLDWLLTLGRESFTMKADLAYGESGSLLLYLHDRGKLKAFYDAFVSGYAREPTGRTALEKTTGMNLAELQNAWTQWLLCRSPPPRLSP